MKINNFVLEEEGNIYFNPIIKPQVLQDGHVCTGKNKQFVSLNFVGLQRLIIRKFSPFLISLIFLSFLKFLETILDANRINRCHLESRCSSEKRAHVIFLLAISKNTQFLE